MQKIRILFRIAALAVIGYVLYREFQDDRDDWQRAWDARAEENRLGRLEEAGLA